MKMLKTVKITKEHFKKLRMQFRVLKHILVGEGI